MHPYLSEIEKKVNDIEKGSVFEKSLSQALSDTSYGCSKILKNQLSSAQVLKTIYGNLRPDEKNFSFNTIHIMEAMQAGINAMENSHCDENRNIKTNILATIQVKFSHATEPAQQQELYEMFKKVAGAHRGYISSFFSRQTSSLSAFEAKLNELNVNNANKRGP